MVMQGIMYIFFEGELDFERLRDRREKLIP
jgi:hypothetical protein